MNGLPYYKAYPRDFMEGTIGMPFELKGAYRLVLDLIYMQGGKLPDDARYISGLLGCSVKAWNGYRSKLIEMGKIRVDGAHLANDRCDAELESLAKLSQVQREKRIGKSKNKDLQKPQFHHTEPEPEPERKRDVGKPTSQRAANLPAKSRMTPEWALSPEGRDFALSHGMTDAQIEEQLADFRIYWMDRRDRDASKSVQGWDMTWRNRVKIVTARIPRHTPNVVPLHSAPSKDTRNGKPRSSVGRMFDLAQRFAADEAEQGVAGGEDRDPPVALLPRH